MVSAILGAFAVVMMEKNITGGQIIAILAVVLSFLNVFLFYQLFQNKNLQQGISLLFSHFGFTTLGVGLFSMKILPEVGMLLLAIGGILSFVGMLKILGHLFYPKNVAN